MCVCVSLSVGVSHLGSGVLLKDTLTYRREVLCLWSVSSLDKAPQQIIFSR